jgi:nucleotide-binding universal stress UspA family protein
LFKKIVLATDFSDQAEIARDVTIHLVKGTNARVTVVTVYHPSDIMMWHGVFLPSEKTQRYEQNLIKQMIEEKLEKYAKDLEKAGIKVEYSMKTGNVADGIVRLAKDINADLIVLGSHSQRTLADVFMGGTAAGVQTKAPCPVLIASAKIKPKKKAKPKKKPRSKKK